MGLWTLITLGAIVCALLLRILIRLRARQSAPVVRDAPSPLDHIVYPRRVFQPLGPGAPRPRPPAGDPLDALRDAGFHPLADRIARGVAPSLRLIATAETDLPVGATKLGGAPDLPPAVEWPRHGDRPLEFLAQVNLADIAKANAATDLPRTGWLLFFAKWDEEYVPWGEAEQAGEWCVLHVVSREALERREPPVVEPPVRCSPCSGIELVPETSYTWIDFEELDEEPDKDALIDWQASWERRWHPTLHRLLGEPQTVQSRSAFLHQLREARPDVPPEDWRLLLQLDSIREDRRGPADWMWGDGGRLYFMIRRDHLAAARFDDTWLVMQCM